MADKLPECNTPPILSVDNVVTNDMLNKCQKEIILPENYRLTIFSHPFYQLTRQWQKMLKNQMCAKKRSFVKKITNRQYQEYWDMLAPIDLIVNRLLIHSRVEANIWWKNKHNETYLHLQTELESNWRFESFKQKAKQFLKLKKKLKSWKPKAEVFFKSLFFITFSLLFTTVLHGQLKNFISSL